jgi:hypothetical protein
MKVNSPMDDFLLDCCFNAVYESHVCRIDSALCQIDSVLYRIAQSVEFKKIHPRLLAMHFNVKFKSKFSGQLCAMRHSTELRLRAMPHSAELTHIREYLGEIETIFENILG